MVNNKNNPDEASHEDHGEDGSDPIMALGGNHANPIENCARSKIQENGINEIGNSHPDLPEGSTGFTEETPEEVTNVTEIIRNHDSDSPRAVTYVSAAESPTAGNVGRCESLRNHIRDSKGKSPRSQSAEIDSFMFSRGVIDSAFGTSCQEGNSAVGDANTDAIEESPAVAASANNEKKSINSGGDSPRSLPTGMDDFMFSRGIVDGVDRSLIENNSPLEFNSGDDFMFSRHVGGDLQNSSTPEPGVDNFMFSRGAVGEIDDPDSSTSQPNNITTGRQHEVAAENHTTQCDERIPTAVLEAECDALRKKAIERCLATSTLIDSLSLELAASKASEENSRQTLAEKEKYWSQHDDALRIVQRQLVIEKDKENTGLRLQEEVKKNHNLQQKVNNLLETISKLKTDILHLEQAHIDNRIEAQQAEINLGTSTTISNNEICSLKATIRNLQASTTEAHQALDVEKKSNMLKNLKLNQNLEDTQQHVNNLLIHKSTTEREIIEYRVVHSAEIAKLKSEIHEKVLSLKFITQGLNENKLQYENDVASQKETINSLRKELNLSQSETAKLRANRNIFDSVEQYKLTLDAVKYKSEHEESQRQISMLSASEISHKKLINEQQEEIDDLRRTVVSKSGKVIVLEKQLSQQEKRYEKMILGLKNQITSQLNTISNTRSEANQNIREITATHTDEVSNLKDTSKTLTKQLACAHMDITTVSDQKDRFQKTIARLKSEVSEQEAQLESCRKDNRELSKGKGVLNNYHFRIIREQLEKSVDENSHLKNRLVSLENKLHTTQIDNSLREENTCSREQMISTEKRCERVLGTLKALCEKLEDATSPPSTTGSLYWVNHLPADLCMQVSNLINKSLTKMLQDDESVSRHKILQPLQSNQQRPATFHGLPRHLSGVVDSSAYLSIQREKLAPSIYDLDW